MPVHCAFDPRGFLTIRVDEPQQAEESARSMRDALAAVAGTHPAVLIDRRQAMPAQTPYIQAIVAQVKALPEAHRPRRVAILVADATSFGVARMVEIMLEGVVPIRAYRKEEDAVGWLLAA